VYRFVHRRKEVGRVMKIKTRTNKWDLIKFKSFCRAKEIIKKTYRMGENICK